MKDGVGLMSKKVHISECIPSDILSRDIVNRQGILVLPKGTVINEYIIRKLIELEIDYICISDRKNGKGIIFTDYHAFEKEFDDNVKDIKSIMHELIKGEKVDYDIIAQITDSIISAWERPVYIIKYMKQIRNKDDYTYFHCINVSFYASLIAKHLNLTRSDTKIVIYASLLHDLGKIKIPNEILNKKGKLTDREYEEIKRHTIYGYNIIKDNPYILDEVKSVILMHHEREDRSGYPLGSGGEELSLYTKIVSVADVYDAMTSDRPYRDALTPFDAFEEFFIIRQSSLDINIVNALIYNLSRYYVGSKVILNDGQEGNIAYIPPHCIQKPIIDIGTFFLDLSKEQELSIIKMI